MTKNKYINATQMTLSLVVRDSADSSKDYYLTTERAVQLYNEGKMEKVEIYSGHSPFYDPNSLYFMERVKR